MSMGIFLVAEFRKDTPVKEMSDVCFEIVKDGYNHKVAVEFVSGRENISERTAMYLDDLKTNERGMSLFDSYLSKGAEFFLFDKYNIPKPSPEERISILRDFFKDVLQNYWIVGLRLYLTGEDGIYEEDFQDYTYTTDTMVSELVKNLEGNFSFEYRIHLYK